MSYEDKYILCYDHGTSGMKTALVSTKGKVVDFTVDEYKLYHPEAGAAEQIPDEWWEALVNTTRRLLKKKNVPLNDIIACTTSNQMDGTIPIDKNGKVLHNCITWMDTRGAEETKRVCGGLLEISGYGWTNLLKWIPKTGGAPGLSGKDILGHILWLKKEKPSIYEKTYKFLDCKDYLNYRLTGKIGTSYDCGILTWVVNDKDPNNIYYDEKLIKKTNIDVEKLPDLYPATHNLGKLKPEIIKELNLHENCDVIMGAGDIATAAVGSGQVLEGQAHICL